MMNASLYLSTLKRCLKLTVIIGSILLFYLMVTMSTYPGEGGTDPYAALPEGMKQALGITGAYSGVTGFMAVSFYGMTFIMFLMIYCVILGNQLISQLVDRGSMAYLLSTPVSRRRIAATQAAVLIGNLLLMTLLVFLTGWATAPFITGEAMDLLSLLKLNMMGFLLFLVISGYMFLFSCWFDEAKHTLAAGGMLSAAFYFLHLMSNMGDGLDNLRYVTILSAFQPVEIIEGGSILAAALSLGLTGVLLYAAGVTVFSKRDLPL